MRAAKDGIQRASRTIPLSDIRPYVIGDRAGWELHIVGHSAGSIFAAHAMPLLSALGIPLKSVQFLAPARIDTTTAWR